MTCGVPMIEPEVLLKDTTPEKLVRALLGHKVLGTETSKIRGI